MKRPLPGQRGGDVPGGQGGSGGGFGKGKGRWGGGSRRRNEQRLGVGGGGALSLAAFASAKSRTTGYNPALIKKQKEFYKNAKLISKYKRTKKQLSQSSSSNPPEFPIHEDGGGNAQHVPKPHHKGKKRTAQSLKEEYEKKCAEDEKAKKEQDAMIQARREQREKSEAKRKELKQKMFKKTRSGQPVMKYRIEHLLQTALESSSK